METRRDDDARDGGDDFSALAALAGQATAALAHARYGAAAAAADDFPCSQEV